MSDKQETVADICAEMRKMPNDVVVDMAAGFLFKRLANRIEVAHKREGERMREVLDKVEDQVRWTIAHIKAGEYDDVTGALYTAECALEHIKRAKEANDESAK